MTDTAFVPDHDIHLYNTMTRRIEPLETIEPGKIRMYVCGVTVYDHAHIGHGMSSIAFDVIRRYLIDAGYDVIYAQNFTDIDDKIINRANAEGIDPAVLTQSLIDVWDAEMAAFNILPASINPRATDEIPAIIDMIQGLIERGHAYESNGDVYFSVRSDPDYGKLSHRDIDDLLVGARITPGEIKRDPLDFALWKAAKPGEPIWPSPWSDGRPGWHIECSAMCSHHLGGTIDIHGGGQDLVFPHHENEIAQSEAFYDGQVFARYWMHNGMLQLSGEKMSKSIGNVVRLADLIQRSRAMAFRLQVLSSHYRAPLTWTEDGLEAAQNALDRLIAAASKTPHDAEAPRDNELDRLVEQTITRFHGAMSRDFDTPNAIAAIFDLARAVNRSRNQGDHGPSGEDARLMLISLCDVLGLDLSAPTWQDTGNAAPFIDLLIEIRKDLRTAKQWALADKVRDELTRLGVTLEDTREGTTWKTT